MKNICVFCGSSNGTDQRYFEEAKKLGRYFAQNKLQLIYGGGKSGLMGAIADEVLANGGLVTGVIPQFLKQKEVAHTGLSQIHVVETMHDRKHLMAELSDAFIAMPGGLGTLEELAEIVTWVQLEIIKKPTGILNTNGFYDHLISQLDWMTEQGFIKPKSRNNIIANHEVNELMESLIDFKFDDYSIWSDLSHT